MARERWEEIVAYYNTYSSIIQQLLKETRAIIRDLKDESLLDSASLIAIVEKESKRKVSNVQVIAEFNAYFRNEIFHYIINYIEEVQEEGENFEPIDIRDYIIDFLTEAINTFDVLLSLAEEDPKKTGSLLSILTEDLTQKLFPKGKSLQKIYDQLIDESSEWYDAQRYILQPTTFFKEEIGEMTIPGLSPKMYQLINNLTALFNLDPNFVDMDSNPNFVIPTVMISEIFDPFIDNIANAENESIKRISSRLEMQIILGVFIGPTETFLDLALPHKYFSTQQDADGKTRWIPQFSNETLILLYLAKTSFRRGFLSKEMINWIAANFAFIIYNTVLHTVLSDENIFYNLFLDLKMEEKILPYLMKLLCFEQYLRLDRTKIRDSPTYRKEIFTFLGRKIEAIDKLTYNLVDILTNMLDQK